MADIFQIIENNGTPKSIEDRKARTNIAPYFEPSNANAIGDLVLSDTGILYRFNAAYSAGTSWSSRTSKEQVNLAEIKAPLDSPAFTGIPTAPTAAAGTSNTQIATTAYADNAIIPINSSINAIDSSLAIVSDGDTHIALSSGQYVYIKNHNSLTEGLYTANSSIGANVALTSSNVTRVQENSTDIGGLNSLLKKIPKYQIYSVLTSTTLTTTQSVYNTYNNRKFSDYDILFFLVSTGGGDFRNIQVIPSFVWINGQGGSNSRMYYTVTHGAQHENKTSINLLYNNDTSLSAYVGLSGTINNLTIYGIKFE